MDPVIEVVFFEDGKQILKNRFELPIFFIVGGADDIYLSNLIGFPIRQLVTEKSVDSNIPTGMFGVYASRALLPTFGKARTFPLTTFLDDEWPVLSDIESLYKDTRRPTDIEMTWIIRALRRAGRNDLADEIKLKMLSNIYSEKLENKDIPKTWTKESVRELYRKLSETQRNYPLVILVDDLPIRRTTTIGDILLQLISGGYIHGNDIKALRTSLEIQSISS
jgi:hypothetical protein